MRILMGHVRNIPNHGEDPGRKVLRGSPDLGDHIGAQVIHSEHPLKIVHDVVHQHSLKPVSTR